MIRRTLQQHSLRPDTDRGQHFLDDEDVVARMVEEAELDGDETVLEIGAGIGTITEKLAAVAGNVVAYENDPDLVRILEKEMDGRDNVEIVEEDVLNGDVGAFDVCVSNIPFHLSSDIIEFLGERGKRSVLLVQKEFAERLVAEPGDAAYSRTSLMTNFSFVPAFLQDIARTSFYPQMDVEAALVKLFPRNEEFAVERDTFSEVVEALFVHSNKKVRNAFYDSRHMFSLDRGEAKAFRDRLPHSEQRVRELGFREMVDVTAFIYREII